MQNAEVENQSSEIPSSPGVIFICRMLKQGCFALGDIQNDKLVPLANWSGSVGLLYIGTTNSRSHKKMNRTDFDDIAVVAAFDVALN